MTLGIGSKLGPYEILAPIGAGGMGEIWRARDTRLDREVAIKLLPDEFFEDKERRGRFEREAKLLAAVNHPNIAAIHSFEEISGRFLLVQELLEGETLREVVSRRSPTARQVLAWGVAIAQGLSAAHRKGIVHRDLKPENLFLTADGRIKILDFGLAKLTPKEVAPPESKLPTASVGTEPGVVLGTIGYMSPEQVRGKPVDPRSDIFSFGATLYELLTGRRAFRGETPADTMTAILTKEPPGVSEITRAVPPGVERIVGRCLEKRPEERFQTAHDLALALEAVLERPSVTALLDVEEKSPYPGLSFFTEEDAGRFFGRENEVKALWEKLRSRRLLALIGPSGAGKTSFVRAGAVARRPEGWAAIVSTPGRTPLRGLGQALGPELSGDPEALRRIAGFEDPETAFELLARWRRSHGEALVVVDQFEELFTLNDVETQDRFAALLGRLPGEADVHVLLSLRDDFLMRCHDHAALSPVFGELTPLGLMTREGLRRAVVEPAAKQGYRFEDEALVEEIIGSVEGVRGSLPLLAFAVSRLWEKRDREKKLLTREACREIGGVEGALARHAEATLDRIGPEREGVVREIFRNLTTAQGTRAVLGREELLSALPDRADAESVLGQLIDARLLTSWETEGGEGEPGGHRVEIVHESLLKAWPRLVRWQTQDADGAQLRDQLRQAAHLWKERGGTEDLLWTGASYLDYRAWREHYPGGLSSVEEEFAREMTAKARRKRRLARVVAAAVVVVSTGVAIAIGVSRHKAVVAAQRAEGSKLLALAQFKVQEDPTEALAFATASLELADTSVARLFALRALQEAPPAWEVESGIVSPRAPAFSPDGRQLAVAGQLPIVGVWTETGGPPIRLPGHEKSPQGPNLAVWASADLLVTGHSSAYFRQVHVWNMPAGRKLRTIDFGLPSFWMVGPGRLFAETQVGESDKPFVGGGLLRSWRLPDGEPEVLGRIDASRLGATSSFFEPYGKAWLFTKGNATYLVPLPVGSGAERLFGRHAAKVEFFILNGRPDLLGQHDNNSGENRLLFFPENGPPVTTIVPKPASAPPRVFCTTSDRWIRGDPGRESKLRLWEAGALPGARPLELRREGSWYGAMCAFDPAARLVVASTHGMSRLTFWPLPARGPSVVDGYKNLFRPLAFSSDGKWLATSWADGRLRLWPLPGSGSTDVKVLSAPADALWTSLAFDPGGRYLFAVGHQDNAWIVPLDGSPGRKLDEYSKDTKLHSAAVSPTGRHVATAFGFGKGQRTLRVWDVETGKVRLFDLPQPPPSPEAPIGYEDGVSSVAFLDDSMLFTSSQGGIRRWDLNAGSNEIVKARAADHLGVMSLSSDRHEIVFCEDDGKGTPRSVSCGAIDLSTKATRPLGRGGDPTPNAAPANLLSLIATQGPVVALAGREGSVRVGLRSGGEPHLLLGHAGAISRVAISSDLRWVASTGEDGTLRLWPMPDLSKPPLHTLPHGELLAKLKSLTNLRAVRDPASDTGWKIEVGPFPGWKNVPTWQP